ncbi:hypothetical protein L7F22_042425 [Adiantum nelumboides]|nr:hypothetical protein [Adiantum nelumboides]
MQGGYFQKTYTLPGLFSHHVKRLTGLMGKFKKFGPFLNRQHLHLWFQKFMLGPVPPQIFDMEKMKSRQDEITIEFDFQWIGNPTIVLVVEIAAVGATWPVQVGLLLLHTKFSSSADYNKHTYRFSMTTRQAKDIPSEYEESEEGTHNSDDSESSKYEPTSERDSSADDSQLNYDQMWRIQLSQLWFPVLGCNIPKSYTGNVSPAKLSALLLTFPKLNNKVLTMEYLAQSMGMANIPTPATDSKTYVALPPMDIVTACEELLSESHSDYTRNEQIFHLLHY